MTKLPRTPEYNFSPHPEKRGAEGGTVIALACVMIAALFVGVLVAVWRLW